MTHYELCTQYQFKRLAKREDIIVGLKASGNYQVGDQLVMKNTEGAMQMVTVDVIDVSSEGVPKGYLAVKIRTRRIVGGN